MVMEIQMLARLKRSSYSITFGDVESVYYEDDNGDFVEVSADDNGDLA